MIGIGRRTGVAALLASTVLAAPSGCMSMEQNQAARQNTANYGNRTELRPGRVAVGSRGGPTECGHAGGTQPGHIDGYSADE